MANIENLIPQSTRTPEEAREMGRKGGIKSGEARRKKRMMRDVYADILAKKYSVKIDQKKVSMTGEELIAEVFPRMVLRGDIVTNGLLREMAKCLDGIDQQEGGESDNELRIIIDRGEDRGYSDE